MTADQNEQVHRNLKKGQMALFTGVIQLLEGQSHSWRLVSSMFLNETHLLFVFLLANSKRETANANSKNILEFVFFCLIF